MAHEARGRTPGGEPGGRGEGRGRNGPAARSLREDLLWAASPRRRELRHGGQHGEAGNRRGGRARRGRSAQAQLALRTAAPSRSAALAVSLSLACWHRPTPTPVSPVAVVPFDAYGGAIYVPAVINGDAARLTRDRGLSRARAHGPRPGAPAPSPPACCAVRGRRVCARSSPLHTQNGTVWAAWRRPSRRPSGRVWSAISTGPSSVYRSSGSAA